MDEHDTFYDLVTELISIVQLLFSLVISVDTVNLLRNLIADHLTRFKESFPSTNIIPKQHYMIHMSSMIKQLRPLIRHSCFAFESAHHYFNRIARKQNFKNLTKSLVERWQMNECSNFADFNNPHHTHYL